VGARLTVGERDAGLESRLGTLLHEFNVGATGIDDGRLLAVRAADGDELFGGLTGWSWGGEGFVDRLWVAAGHRGRGLGSALMDAAEAELELRGCGRVLLTTHSFQAPGFYTRRGYSVVTEVPDHPPGHAWLVLAKPLRGGPAVDGVRPARS
jgi:GNAT superfamily N-acetyltransferase